MKSVLYLGDTALDRAASYLSAILYSSGINSIYVPSNQPFLDKLITNDISAIVISDYPASNFTNSQLNSIAQRVSAGMGLAMIGGWESFTGSAGDYQDTVLKEVLPVKMSESDDRVNGATPCAVFAKNSHQIINSVPFKQYPPCVCGYNRLTAKDDSHTILSIRKYRIDENLGEFSFQCENEDPLLVLGTYGQGRVVAYASDVAPHWAGGFVDWGNERLAIQAPDSVEVEIGNWYIEFFRNLINWILSNEL